MKSYPKIKLYPNPSNDYVILEMVKGNVTGAEVDIIDNNGRKVNSFAIPGKSQQAVIPLKGFSKGLYLVKVRYEGSVIGTKKLTIL